jgi:hypothetical protein
MQTPKNTSKLLLSAFLIGLMVFVGWVGGFFFGEMEENSNFAAVKENSDANSKVQIRESITFIMGEDGETAGPATKNRYYTQAKQYYQLNPEARTERLITNLRSLQAVRDYLESNPPANGQPWGRINMVVHSNEWTGMEAPVLPDGKRTDVKKLRAAMESGAFPPLVNELIDSETEMMIFGCALGRDRELLETLSEAFGGEAPDLQRPVVRSSRYFVNYFTETVNGRPLKSQRMLTDFRYAFFKTGYQPADYKLVQQLKKRYPGDSINYSAALSRSAPDFPGQSYHHTFKVPVVLLVTYDKAEDRPDFGTEEKCMAWLDTQTQLDSVFLDFELDKSLFTWTFQKIRYEQEDGSKVPAVKLIGLCDILCILDPLKDKNGNLLAPAFDDPLYFAQVGPKIADKELQTNMLSHR